MLRSIIQIWTTTSLLTLPGGSNSGWLLNNRKGFFNMFATSVRIPVRFGSDVYYVNTCAFTAEAFVRGARVLATNGSVFVGAEVLTSQRTPRPATDFKWRISKA